MRSSVFLAAMTTAAVLLTAQPSTARADLAVRQSFNIPAQSLSSALIAFSKQADVQVVGSSDAVATHKTKGISGEYTGREALRMLLQNNPLVFEEVTARSVRILPADSEGKRPDGRAGALDVLGSAGFRLAMASVRTADEDEEKTATSAQAAETETATLTVLGSRIRRTDMEGPSPVSVYDREYIRATGALTLADFLNSLPQNYAGISAGRGSAPNELNPEFGQRTETTSPAFNFILGASAAPPGQTGVSGVSLRGLGSGSTLVLVDGRRVVQSGSGNRSTDSRQGFVDLNTIPLAMVDRIEIITDGASALYGADAVAGVINIVMKKDWTGGELTTNVHGAFDGGGRERQGSFTYGFTTGAFRGNISLQGFDRLPLRASERDFSADQNHTGVVAGYNATTGAPIFGRDFRLNWGYPGVVQALNGTLNGVTDPNGNPTGFAAINAGVTGAATLNDFTGLTTSFASGAVRGNTAEFLDLIPETSRWSASGNLNFTINDNVESYATYTISDSRGMFNGQAAVSSASTNSFFGNVPTVVPAAFNPFGQDIAVGLVHYEFGSTWQKTQTRAHNAVLGVRGVIGQSSWRWDSYVGYQKQIFHQTTRVFNSPTVTAALANPDPAQRLDPFIDARVAGITQADIYSAMALFPTLDTEADMKSIDVSADGELFNLPGGAVRMAAGGFFERNTNQSFAVTYPFSGGVNAMPTLMYIEGERDSYGVFSELSVPLFGSDNALPLVRRLELQLAGRYEDRDDAGSATVPKIGVSWVPVRSLLVRASFSEGFRAPALTEYQVASSGFNATITDPMRGTIVAPGTPAATSNVAVTRGSNPDIKPETSDTLYFGLVFEPPWIRGMNFEVNYYKTEQDDAIQVLSAQTIANNQASFGERITRGPQGPDDITLNQPGPITAIDQTLINFGKITNESLDFVVNYSLSSWAGNIRVGANASHVLESSRELRPGVEAVDDLGDTFAPPKWRFNVFTFWDRGPWNASAYFTHLTAFSTNQAGNLFTSSYPIPSQTKVDLNGGYEFRDGLWGGRAKGLRVGFGIGNVFDEEPPFSDTVFGYNGALHSPLGRTWQTSIQMPF